MSDNKKYFIANLNLLKIRKSIGLTQEEFASEIGIKRSLLGAYEEYRAEVKTEVIKRIIDNGYLLQEQLYDFFFCEEFKAAPTFRYKKTRIKKLFRQHETN